MLNELEKRVLRYMIAQNSEDCISINFPEVPPSHLKGAVKSLAQNGYVLDACTFETAAAVLTEKGSYALQTENVTLYGAYSDKITQLEDYIAEGCRLLSLHDKNKIIALINNIVAVYGEKLGQDERQGICLRLGMEKESATSEACEDELRPLIEKLKGILSDTKIEATKQKEINIQNINNVNANMQQNVNVTISLSFVIGEIYKTDLSDKEKNEIIKILAEIERKPPKKRLWDKIKDALRFLLDKSIEIGAIVLPFLSSFLDKTGL